MPANYGLWAHDHQSVSPLRPDPRERDPERSVQWAQPRPRSIIGVDCELLSESQLDDCLILTIPEEGEEASKESDPEIDQRPHGMLIVLDRTGENESESRVWSCVSSEDGESGQGGKAEYYQRGRILRTDKRRAARVCGLQCGMPGAPMRAKPNAQPAGATRQIRFSRPAARESASLSTHETSPSIPES